MKEENNMKTPNEETTVIECTDEEIVYGECLPKYLLHSEEFQLFCDCDMAVMEDENNLGLFVSHSLVPNVWMPDVRPAEEVRASLMEDRKQYVDSLLCELAKHQIRLYEGVGEVFDSYSLDCPDLNATYWIPDVYVSLAKEELALEDPKEFGDLE